MPGARPHESHDGTTHDAPESSAIERRIQDARRELLDLSGRNRLLNAARSARNRRAKIIEIVDELADEIFRILVVDKKEMTFLPESSAPSDEDGESTLLALPPDEDPDDELAAHHTDRRLQTNLDSLKLDRRLRGLHYDARTAFEEQGFNILFLAIGFLGWYESVDSDRERFAPLLLIPVEIDRTSAQAAFKLRFTEEDLSTNISLQEKLRSEFSVELPELPELEDLKPSEYFKDVRAAVGGHDRWEVLDDDMLIGIFSFSKLMMYRDLDPENWLATHRIADHEILGGLLGSGRFDETAHSEDAHVDEITEPSDLLHVLDADSSQTLAIEEVRAGRNLVIQGPPGTGKSQTITNLIAAAVADGQTVLFVAEKRAALEVVKRRLDHLHLGEMCLELHSHKARKKQVLADIEKTLQLGRPEVDGGRLSDDIKHRRDRLNRHAWLIHRPLDPGGVTPFRALGELASLQGRGLEPPGFALAQAPEWERARVDEIRRSLEEQVRLLAVMGTPEEHPWKGVGLQAVLPPDAERFRNQCESVKRALRSVTEAAARFSEAAGRIPGTLSEAEAVQPYADALLAAPRVDSDAMRSALWNKDRSSIETCVSSGERLRAARGATTDLKDSAWRSDLSEVRAQYARRGTSIFRMLSSDYRAARAELRSHLKGEPPDATAAIRLLDALAEGQEAARDLAELEPIGAEAFGMHWQSDRSRWSELRQTLDWDTASVTDGLLWDHREGLGLIEDPKTLRSAKEELDAAASKFGESLSQLLADLEFETAARFSTGIEAVSFAEWDRWLSIWSTNSNRIHEWISFSARDDSLRGLGMGELCDLIHDGRVGPDELIDVFDYAYYESLLRKTWQQHPELSSFDGRSHQLVVDEFRELEERKKQLSRDEVSARHYERIPRGQAIGEMQTIRREIEKKRRHLPLRKLIDTAGQAIQRIKPVFMMSPMSVAQYLPPGRMEFDLLLVDEASQVRPVEALGAIARARQVAVVGDKRQLPPTRFFDSLLEIDEDDEDRHVGDLESVLALAEAEGVPSRMLRWHYRSRHESLITVSNSSFYNGDLFIPPSADDTDLGVTFHHFPDAVYDRGASRTNRGEATAVAHAVLEFAQEHPEKTLGVGTFSSAQRDAVLDEIELLRRQHLRRQHSEFEPFFSEQGAEPFFVKNLETIQGDERDTIFLSVGYGRDASGYMSMGFGPLSQEGGERRLNVLISRARERMEVFSSITADDIDLGRTNAFGVRVLKRFLRFAEKGFMDEIVPTGETDSPFEEEVARALTAMGHTVVHQVGTAGFFVDLAIVDPSRAGRYLLGIECDGATYHSSRSARDRDRLRQAVLESRGWRICRIWSIDWWKDPEGQLRRIERMLLEGPAPDVPHERSIPAPSRSEVTTHSLASSTAAAPYVVAEFSVDNQSDIHETRMGRLVDYARRIISIEGPIHRTEVARRLTTLWGQSRAGRRIQEAVDRALAICVARADVAEEHDFYWIPDTSIDAPRDRSDPSLPSTLRKAANLPPIEIQVAIGQVLRQNIGASAEDIVRETTRAFGFKQTGSDLKAVVEAELQRMLGAGVVKFRGEQVYLSEGV